MGGTEIVLVAAVVFVPLAIAIVVTLWTLEPAAQRAERAKRGRKRSQAASETREKDSDPQLLIHKMANDANQDDRIAGTP